MPTAVQSAKKVYPAHGDPIRIVPLHVPDAVVQPTADAAAAPAAAPQLTYRNGPLLTAVEVFTIFWGPLWQQAAQSAMATQINQFFDFILTSPLLDQLAEYNVPGKQIGHGRRTGSITIVTPALRRSVSDGAIQHMLQQQGWYDDANGEIGDICAWKTKRVGQYTVQLEWSNQANNCV